MKEIIVGIADCRISNDPAAILVTHALGSCVAVAVHDPQSGVAGLLHVLLPESSLDPGKAAIKPYQFADTGIPLLFHAACALGAEKKRLTVRLVGGAQVMQPGGASSCPGCNSPGCPACRPAARRAPPHEGARAGTGLGAFNVGKRNHLACRKVLWAAGVMIHGEEVGGVQARTVRLEPGGGRLWCSTPGNAPVEIPVRKGGRS